MTDGRARGGGSSAAPFPAGPLGVHPRNPRWLATPEGTGVLLAGSHHWDSLVDNDERPGGLDLDAYLALLARHGHSCVRLWALEGWLRPVRPTPWLRTGPGLAHDGLPKHDLAHHDPAYFARLRERVETFGRHGLYVAVMLWNGWSLQDKGDGNPWPNHPFHRDNNVSGIDGDREHDGDGILVQTLRFPVVLAIQERCVDAVVAAVGDLPHVLWEVANEAAPASLAWQERVVEWIREAEARRGFAPHPVGITATFPTGDNQRLFASAADWISPSRKGGWMRSPPAADGRKVVLLDTDHLWGIGGDAAWVWRAFTRGYGVLYMDPLDDDPLREGARRAIGETVRLAREIGIERMVPEPRRASSRHALVAVEGAPTVVAWAPRGVVKVDLRGIAERERMRVRWHDVAGGGWSDGGEVAGGGWVKVRAPSRGAAVLLLTALR